MNWVGVMPWTYRPYYESCIATMHPAFKENLLIIDNSTKETNLGVMKSHNRGIDFMRERGADWLIVISPAIRFGDKGGLDFLEILEQHPDYHVIHGASENVKGGKQQTGEDGGHNKVFGWHLMGINKTVFEAIGTYDENFSNYSLDDIDMSLRISKGVKNVKWETYPCDVTDTRMSYSLHFVPHVVGGAAYPPRNSYFKRKWNREGGEWQKEAWDHPFNDETKPLSYWPLPDDPRSIHQIEFKLGEWSFDD